MAKVTITHMKAPWPAGAKEGDVVAFDGKVPSWAVGKCVPADGGAKADHVYEPPTLVTGDGSGQALPPIEAVNAEIEELRKKLADAEAALAEAQKLATDEKARGDDLAKKLADAEAALAEAQKLATDEKARGDDLAKKLADAEAALAEAQKLATDEKARGDDLAKKLADAEAALAEAQKLATDEKARGDDLAKKLADAEAAASAKGKGSK